MEVRRARKRPVINDFVELTDDNGAEVAEWCGGEWRPEAGAVLVPTIAGQVRATPEDLRYVMQGTWGEFYPIRPDVYAQAYQEPGGPGMRLHPEGDGYVAVCDCGYRAMHHWSIRDACVQWARHVIESPSHREEL